MISRKKSVVLYYIKVEITMTEKVLGAKKNGMKVLFLTLVLWLGSIALTIFFGNTIG